MRTLRSDMYSSDSGSICTVAKKGDFPDSTST